MNSLNEKILSESYDSDHGGMDGFILKKVYFRDKDDNSVSRMLVDSTIAPPISWKDKLSVSGIKKLFASTIDKIFRLSS